MAISLGILTQHFQTNPYGFPFGSTEVLPPVTWRPNCQWLANCFDEKSVLSPRWSSQMMPNEPHAPQVAPQWFISDILWKTPRPKTGQDYEQLRELSSALVILIALLLRSSSLWGGLKQLREWGWSCHSHAGSKRWQSWTKRWNRRCSYGILRAPVNLSPPFHIFEALIFLSGYFRFSCTYWTSAVRMQ